MKKSHISRPCTERNVSVRMSFKILDGKSLRNKMQSIFPQCFVSAHEIWTNAEISSLRD